MSKDFSEQSPDLWHRNIAVQDFPLRLLKALSPVRLTLPTLVFTGTFMHTQMIVTARMCHPRGALFETKCCCYLFEELLVHLLVEGKKKKHHRCIFSPAARTFVGKVSEMRTYSPLNFHSSFPFSRANAPFSVRSCRQVVIFCLEGSAGLPRATTESVLSDFALENTQTYTHTHAHTHTRAHTHTHTAFCSSPQLPLTPFFLSLHSFFTYMIFNVYHWRPNQYWWKMWIPFTFISWTHST